jgi:chaperonin GroEL
MRAKEFRFGEEAHRKIVKGVNLLADAVRTTIGPRGRYVIMGVGAEAPYITKDGMTIAGQMELKDRFENLGAQAVREVALQMAEDVGDGTSTATLLAQTMIREGMKRITTGIDPTGLIRGLEAAANLAAMELASVSRPCLTQPELRQAAIVAANGDEEIGSLLAEAIRLVGKDGAIVIDEAYGTENEMVVTEGMELEWPALTARYGDRSEDGVVRLENPRIAVIDGPVSSPAELLPMLELMSKTQVPLVIFAHDVADYVLTLLAMNAARGVLKVCAIKASGGQEERHAALEDLALATGATLLAAEGGLRLRDLTLGNLGRATSVRVSAKRVTVIGGDGDHGLMVARVRRLNAQSKKAIGVQQRELKLRIGRLAGAVATITAGAGTQVAAKEKRERLQAASLAAQAAAAEGIVVGGGVALLRTSAAVAELMQGHESFDAGVGVLLHALEAPLCQIAENAGQEPRVVLSRVQQEAGAYGFNAVTGEYGDLLKMGVIDPTKVVRSALRIATSVAANLLAAECLIVAAEPESGSELRALRQRNGIEANLT